MVKNYQFRDLTADDVEVRVAMVRQNGVSLLIYKDARVDQAILDETVGQMNWKKSYKVVKDNLYCTIEIWDGEKGQWVSKEDCGVESNTEKEKGEASDAQKRAGFVWGIGRELYTAPFIWVPSDKCEIVEGNKCRTTFNVTSMKVENKKIVELQIANSRTGEIVYSMNSIPVAVKTQAKASSKVEVANTIETKPDFSFLERVIHCDGKPDMSIQKMIDSVSTLKAAKAVKTFLEKLSKEQTRSEEDRDALSKTIYGLDNGTIKFANIH